MMKKVVCVSEFNPGIPAFFQSRNPGIENGSIPDQSRTSGIEFSAVFRCKIARKSAVCHAKR